MYAINTHTHTHTHTHLRLQQQPLLIHRGQRSRTALRSRLPQQRSANAPEGRFGTKAPNCLCLHLALRAAQVLFGVLCARFEMFDVRSQLCRLLRRRRWHRLAAASVFVLLY